MKTSHTTERITVLLLCVLLVGALGAGVFLAPAETLTEVRLIDDPSGSVARSTVADELVDVVGRVEGVSDRFEVEVVALGEKRSGYMPKSVVRASGRRPGLVIEKKATGDRSWEAPLRQALATVPPAQQTSLQTAIDTTLRTLRDRHCETPEVRCLVVIRTDGLEEIDRLVVRRLRGEVVPTSEARLKNDDIDVIFCGLAERASTPKAFRPPPSLERIEAAWIVEFTAPAKVTFLPSCHDVRVN